MMGRPATSVDYQKGYSAGYNKGRRALPTGMVVSWAAKNGYWNGDFFGDWFAADMKEDDPDYKLWFFLHRWHDGLARLTVEDFNWLFTALGHGGNIDQPESWLCHQPTSEQAVKLLSERYKKPPTNPSTEHSKGKV